MTSFSERASVDDTEKCARTVEEALAPLLAAGGAAPGDACDRAAFEQALCELVALETEERLLDVLAGTAAPERPSATPSTLHGPEGSAGAGAGTPAASLARAAVMLERDLGTSVQQLTAEAELCAVAAREYAATVRRLEDMQRTLESGQGVRGSVSVAVQTDP